MSQNKLLMNERARNHIKVFPVGDDVFDNIPSDAAGKIKWCESMYRELQTNVKAKRIYLDKHKGKGYLISVWELDGRYYMIQCLRNEFKTFNTTIYISREKDDMLNIARFLRDNVDQIMADYKDQLLAARDALVRDTVVAEAEEHTDGDA